MKRSVYYSFLVALSFFSGSCTTTNTKDEKPTVTVSIIPQQFFINQIAGNWLQVNVMIPPGGNPHTYEPTPLQMKALSKSSAYFKIGQITFEHAWMEKLVSVSPNMKVFDTSEGISFLTDDSTQTHADAMHNHEHHHNEMYNPHIWLSPGLVKTQAKNMFNALAALYPEHKQEMEHNLNRFLVQCDSVHIQLKKQLSEVSGTSFIVYHPVWTYLSHDYQLKQVAIEHNGKEATADKLKFIIDFATQNQIKMVFVQKEFSDAQARTIASQINGRVVSMNPLDYNWFNTMKEFGEAFNLNGN